MGVPPVLIHIYFRIFHQQKPSSDQGVLPPMRWDNLVLMTSGVAWPKHMKDGV